MKSEEFWNYCFAHAPIYGDRWYWHVDDLFDPDFETLTELLINTFENSKQIAGEYLPNQIALGLDFILSDDSGYFSKLRKRKTIDEIESVRSVFKSFKKVYDSIFTPLASPALSHTKQSIDATSHLNTLLYMLGDSSNLQSPIWFENESEIHDCIFEIFEYGFESENIAVIESSIHAFGHFGSKFSGISEKLRSKFDNRWPDELKNYWKNAIVGNIQ